ncbi:MAG: SpoIID/LytB domain-containing protein [Clostridia bacterium]|nr:SpoIID/LytB domain-containing protein [Clostridia bacterium]
MTLRRRLACLLAVLLLACTLFPAACADGPIQTVRVLLQSLALTDRCDLWTTGPYTAECEGTEVYLPAGVHAVAMLRENAIWLFVDNVSLRAGKNVTLRQNASGSYGSGLRLSDGGNLYPGDLKLTIADGKLRAMLTIGVEDYLLGVVPYEMADSFPLEALKAQAVCARTYALSHRNTDREWDMTDTTADQVFRGVNSAYTNAAAAVIQTTGVVAMVNGNFAVCYYSASNGGRTELPQNVWGGSDAPSCYAIQEDPYDLANPESPVKRVRLRQDGSGLPESLLQLLAQRLSTEMQKQGFMTGAEHLRVDMLTDVSLGGGNARYPATTLSLTFWWSGHKSTDPAMFVPGQEAATVTVNLFPDGIQALGLSIAGMNNEQVTLVREEDAWRIESRRYGHGVGMSQRGAQYLAENQQASFDQILGFYYPGIQLMVGGTARTVLPTVRPSLAETPGPAATATPRPTLMPVTSALPAGAYLASVEGVAEDSSLNLRAEPNSAATILMRLLPHQRVIVLELCEDPVWAHVKTDTAEGYVMVSFLSPVQDTP